MSSPSRISLCRAAAEAHHAKPDDHNLRVTAWLAAWSCADADPNRRHITAKEIRR